MFNIHAQNELADIDRVIDKADDSLDSQGTPVHSINKTPEEVLKSLTPEQREVARNNLVYQSWTRIQDSIRKMPNGSKVIGFLNSMPEYKDLSTRYKNLTQNQTPDKLVDGKTIDELANMGFSTILTNNLQAQEAAILARAKSIEKKLQQQDIIRKQRRLQQFNTASFNLRKIKTSQIQPYLEDLDSKSIFIKKYLPLLLSNDINQFNSARNEILSSVGLGTAMVDEVRTLLESIQQLTPERIQEAEEILDNIYTNWMSPTSKTQESIVMSQNNPKSIIKHDLSDRVLNNKLNKEAAANIGAESLLYGPTEKRICPKLRGKGGGVPGSSDVVSEYTCRHHCLDGIVIDDNKTVCGEALWRANVMDKFSREYVNEEGDIVGGYLNKRFEINRNVPEENKMRLKPGETRKPRPPELGNLEARMQAMRKKEGEKRGYRPQTDKSEPFNWCKDVDQNNINVSQSEKDKREENSGHELVNYSKKDAFNLVNFNKTSQHLESDNSSSNVLETSDNMSDIKTVKAKCFNLHSIKYAGPIDDIKSLNDELRSLDNKSEIGTDEETSKLQDISDKQNTSVNVPVSARSVAAFNMKRTKVAQGDNVPGTFDGRDFVPSESTIRDNDFDHNFEQCPVCDGEGQELGALGRLMHYKCRNCGTEFSKKVDYKEAKNNFTYKGESYKTNPFAVCNKTVGKKEDPEKYERCVQDVKKDSLESKKKR